MSISRMSLVPEGLSIDIARACCSSAFSSSYNPESSQIIRIVLNFLAITYVAKGSEDIQIRIEERDQSVQRLKVKIILL